RKARRRTTNEAASRRWSFVVRRSSAGALRLEEPHVAQPTLRERLRLVVFALLVTLDRDAEVGHVRRKIFQVLDLSLYQGPVASRLADDQRHSLVAPVVGH